MPTAVAIFGADQRLTFYNAAYRALWDLDAAFLDQSPTDSAVLDQLRARASCRSRPTSANGRTSCMRPIARSSRRSIGGTCRTGGRCASSPRPNPEGGVTYLFDDVTERLDLERRYDALIRVQGETLDNLSEAVAVFGSDGRLRLLQSRLRPHVETVADRCSPSIRISRP